MIYRTIVFLLLCVALHSCKSRHTAPDEGFGNDDQVLRISSLDDPSSLDPRLVRDLPTTTLLHMLYEGLLRLDFHGKIVPGLAEEVLISSDQKTYTFKLRESQWSNGDPLTAEDFVRTWKSILDPTFPSPTAYQFYPIKGAKAAKEGKGSLKEVGIRAPDSKTLVVELESPLVYFSELVSTFFFFPTHAKSTSTNLITNGPFRLFSWEPHHEIKFKRSPNYWDQNEVRLDGIIVEILAEQTALRLYETGELDWTGSPMSTLPQDSVETLKHQRLLKIIPGAGTHWFRFNTTKTPFTNLKMRKAFTLALNRKALVEHVTQGGQKPALGIVPPSLGLNSRPTFEDSDVPGAWTALQEALVELDVTKDEIPSITLIYTANDRNEKIAQAVQQQWLKALGIEVKLQAYEHQIYMEKLKSLDFQVASGSWFADFQDPINFLEIFKSKENETNSTGWEDPTYTDLLNQSSLEKNPLQRALLLQKCEAILLQEFPVAPLFFSVFNYVKDESLLGVYFSDLGYLDFKYAFFGD